MILKILLSVLALVAGTSARAVFGVGDVVIVAADPAHELMWASEELPKWIEMIGKAETQVQHGQEMINIVGHPKDFAQQLVNEAKPGFALTLDANSLTASTHVLDFTRASWTLYKTSPKNSPSVLDVPESYQVLGNTVMRDRTAYVDMASEKALRGRLSDAIVKKNSVDAQELTYQQRTLTALGAAQTQSEIELHQAGLSASNQRMQIAGARVDQAQGELNAFMGDNQLEQRKQTQLQTEQSAKFVDLALERAKQATTPTLSPAEL